jgi:hypothetical protein
MAGAEVNEAQLTMTSALKWLCGRTATVTESNSNKVWT